MISFEECLKAGLVRKTHPSTDQAREALAKAKESLDDAKMMHKSGRWNSVAVLSYLAMFNAARSLLFKDGYREKSHACVARYLEAKYTADFPAPQIEMLDIYREKRHDVQYSTAFHATEDDARQMIEFSEGFILSVERILDKKTTG